MSSDLLNRVNEDEPQVRVTDDQPRRPYALGEPNALMSPETIALQIRTLNLRRNLRAGRRDGSGYFEACALEQGIAYRPYGSQDDSEWRWTLEQLLSKECEVTALVDDEIRSMRRVIRQTAAELLNWRERYRAITAVMGKKTRKRLGKMAANEILADTDADDPIARLLAEQNA